MENEFTRYANFTVELVCEVYRPTFATLCRTFHLYGFHGVCEANMSAPGASNGISGAHITYFDDDPDFMHVLVDFQLRFHQLIGFH